MKFPYTEKEKGPLDAGLIKRGVCVVVALGSNHQRFTIGQRSTVLVKEGAAAIAPREELTELIRIRSGGPERDPP
jgi:hypothetical protein